MKHCQWRWSNDNSKANYGVGNEICDKKMEHCQWRWSNDNSKANYGVGNEIIYNTKVLKSNLCDYNDAYILVTGNITIIGDNAHGVASKHCTAFTKCITNIDETKADDAQDLDLVISKYVQFNRI